MPTHAGVAGIDGAEIWFTQGAIASVHTAMTNATAGRGMWIVGGGGWWWAAGQFADAGLLDQIVQAIASVTIGAVLGRSRRRGLVAVFRCSAHQPGRRQRDEGADGWGSCAVRAVHDRDARAHFGNVPPDVDESGEAKMSQSARYYGDSGSGGDQAQDSGNWTACWRNASGIRPCGKAQRCDRRAAIAAAGAMTVLESEIQGLGRPQRLVVRIILNRADVDGPVRGSRNDVPIVDDPPRRGSLLLGRPVFDLAVAQSTTTMPVKTFARGLGYHRVLWCFALERAERTHAMTVFAKA